MHSPFENITIRAGSPDNEQEHRAIVKLLENTFGAKFPIDSAYDPQFWKTHIGSRFVSLLGISQEKQIVGHLAYAPDRESPLHVQILFPFCSCDCSDRSECLTQEFGQKAWQTIHNQGLRQNWEAIYFFAINNSKSMQAFAEDVMHASCIGILPFYLAGSGAEDKNGASGKKTAGTHVLIYEKVLSTANLSGRHYYPPELHQLMFESLADSLEICPGKPSKATSSQSIKHTISPSRSGISRNHFAHTGVAHVFLKPALLDQQEISAEKLKLDKARVSYLFVDANDPAAAAVCSALENLGLRFSGFIPYLGKQHSFIYSYFPHNQESFSVRSISSKFARSLANYVESYKGSPVQSIKAVNHSHALAAN